MSGEDAYNIFCEQTLRYGQICLPLWSDLDWRERDKWDAVADEIIAQDKEDRDAQS